MVDLMLHSMEVEFQGGWVVGGWWTAIIVSNPTRLSEDEDVLRLSWGCDNNLKYSFDIIF